MLLLVDWADDGTIAGLTPDGQVFEGTTGAGGTVSDWRKTGAIGGQPEALDVTGKDSIYAVTGAKVLLSTDGGSTFSGYGK